MRNNSNDRTLERNYLQKFRFLMREYELVKGKRHHQFRFLQDFYTYHGTNRQTFAEEQPLPPVGSERRPAAS